MVACCTERERPHIVNFLPRMGAKNVHCAGGIYMGQLADKSSPRMGIIISLLLGAGPAYVLLGASTSLPILFLSRLPTTLMASMQLVQSYLTKLNIAAKKSSKAKDKTLNSVILGRLSLSYGIGMVAGSAVGGIMAQSIGIATVLCETLFRLYFFLR